MMTRLDQERFAFVGGGNVAQALIGGLISRGSLHPTSLQVVEPAEETRRKLVNEFRVWAQSTPSETLSQASIVVLAVKPQIMREVCAQIRPFLGDSLIVSVAAGVRASDLAQWLGARRIVRTMPNTPALVGAGFTGLAALPGVSDADRELADHLLRAVGETLWVDDEAMLDPITALSGSGPGYVFYFMEAMQAAAMQLGFGEEEAHRLTVATFSGAAKLAAASSDSARVLREKVTSPNGTTFAAVTCMNQHQVSQGIMQGIEAAAARSRELGHELGQALR